MDEQELGHIGETFRVGEDLYGVSVEQLRERSEVLKMELARIEVFIVKKNEELTVAETFFKKT
ncbi:MAG: hypothetical protein COA43_10485 [Robiginitomaculum sp.]|nr:MAG: hypothetical protein COA43_10485 [Robiginitomaculum sp.]